LHHLLDHHFLLLFELFIPCLRTAHANNTVSLAQSFDRNVCEFTQWDPKFGQFFGCSVRWENNFRKQGSFSLCSETHHRGVLIRQDYVTLVIMINCCLK
jgi:hypothetical protein